MTRTELIARVDELEKENAELREALGPFAETGDYVDYTSERYGGPPPDNAYVCDWTDAITIGMCRRASRLLKINPK